jgi:hypothetical protein
MFGVEVDHDRTIRGQFLPKLVAILIEWHASENTIVATPMSIVLAIVRDAYGLSLPDRLAVPHIRTHPVRYTIPATGSG